MQFRLKRFRKGIVASGILAVTMLVLSACGAKVSTETPTSANGGTAQPAKEWKPTHDMTWIVPYSAGGGFDLYSRALANVLKKHVGVNIAIENVEGAAGIQGMTKLYNAAPDGHTLGIVPTPSVAANQLLDPKLVKYDGRKFAMLGSIDEQPYGLFVSKKSKYQTLDAMRKATDLKYATVGKGNSSHVAAVVGGGALGLKAKVITVGTGSKDAALAAARGDVDYVVYNYTDVVQFVDGGDLIPLVVFGDTSNRPEQLKNVPTTQELGIAGAGGVTEYRLVAAPPGTPPEIKDYLRKKVAEAMNDPEFKKWSTDAKRSIKPRTGDEADKILNDVYGTMAALIDKLRDQF